METVQKMAVLHFFLVNSPLIYILFSLDTHQPPFKPSPSCYSGLSHYLSILILSGRVFIYVHMGGGPKLLFQFRPKIFSGLNLLLSSFWFGCRSAGGGGVSSCSCLILSRSSFCLFNSSCWRANFSFSASIFSLSS